MSTKYETQPVTVERVVALTTNCDRCGRPREDATFNVMSAISLEVDPGEEGEILCKGDICYDCYEEHGEVVTQIAKMIRELLPNGSFRSRTMLEWNGTGEFADDA